MAEQTPGEQHRWPQEPEFPPNLFAGTSEYYARYRPRYPGELLDHLRLRAQITGHGRLLDLACGTGEIALPLAPFFRHVTAVDQEQEMIGVGQMRATDAGVTNVTWAVGRAEDVYIRPGSLELITIGNAFHRLNRRLIGRHAMTWLQPGGGIAILNSSSLWSGNEDWQHAAVEVIKKWKTTSTASARGDASRPDETHQESLQHAGFEQLEEHEFNAPHTWTVDTFIGYLFSTAASSKAVFGDTAEAFEADLERTLLALEPSGQLHETISFHYILARRPIAR